MFEIIGKPDTKTLPIPYDYLAPDGSEIRHLVAAQGGNMVHCMLPEGGVTTPVYHRTIEELWYFISGQGEVWRKYDEEENLTSVATGTSLTIPLGTTFQFRNTSKEPLCFIIVSMPPWPGSDEAVIVKNGRWPVKTST